MKYKTLKHSDPAGLDMELNELSEHGLDIQSIAAASGPNHIVAIISYRGDMEKVHASVKAKAQKSVNQAAAAEHSDRAQIEGNKLKQLAIEDRARLDKIQAGNKLIAESEAKAKAKTDAKAKGPQS